jgi:ankyrin repeat protein
MPPTIRAALRAACAWFVVSGLHAAEPVGHRLPKSAERRVDFATDIKPLLEQSCLPCHGPEKPKSGHRVDARHAIIKGGDSDEAAIQPGKSESSPLVHYIAGVVPDMEMPPLDSRDKYPALSPEQIGLVRAWIEQGVAWPDTITLTPRKPAAADTIAVAKTEVAAVNPIFAQIRAGDIKAIRASLSDRSVLQARDAAGNTPLMQAAFYLDATPLELFLKHGADPHATNRAGATALMKAVADVAKVRLLLAAGAKPNERSAAGNTALIVACHQYGATEVVKELLAHQADVNAANSIGINALVAAAETGDPDVLGLLIARGANVNSHFRPPYSTAAESALMVAANHGHLECVKLLLKHGADPRFTSDYGNALHFAAAKDRLEIARLLIERGVDLNLPGRRISSFRNDLALTPLMYAAMTERNDPTLVQLLIDRGAKVNAKNAAGETALALAQKRGETRVVAALRAAGATADGTKLSGPELRPLWTRAQVEKDAPAVLRSAAENGLAVLQGSGMRFDDATAGRCFTCHQHSQPAMATRLAMDRQFGYDKTLAANLLTSAVKTAGRRLDSALEEPAPVPSIPAWLLIGLHAAGHAPDELTDSYAYSLARSQFVDGRWITRAVRAPTDYSDVTVTALAIRALKLYAPPTMEKQFGRRIESAAAWLRRVRPESTDERVFQILGLHWAGSDQRQIAELADVLRRQQREDGGWAQLPTLKSDAYATGLVLVTLHQAASVQPQHDPYRKGVAFLLTQQLSDGSWFVETRASPVQVAVDSVFSHGKDQWISSSATTWSTMALMLGAGTAGDRKTVVKLE